MDIAELKSKSIAELHAMAEELNISNYSGLRKQDLIFRIEQSLLDTETVLEGGMLGLIFEKAQNKIQDPAKLRQLIVERQHQRLQRACDVVQSLQQAFLADGMDVEAMDLALRVGHRLGGQIDAHRSARVIAQLRAHRLARGLGQPDHPGELRPVQRPVGDRDRNGRALRIVLPPHLAALKASLDAVVRDELATSMSAMARGHSCRAVATKRQARRRISKRSTTARSRMSGPERRCPAATTSPSGNGSAQHLALELFKQRAQVDALHVPYKGSGPLLTDLIGGQIQYSFETMTAATPHVKSGKAIAIAQTRSRRVAAYPDVPTLREMGYQLGSPTLYGILAPKDTPKEVVDALYGAARKVVDAFGIVGLTSAVIMLLAYGLPGTSAPRSTATLSTATRTTGRSRSG